MRVLLQRVNFASVSVNNEIKGQIDRGLMLLIGFGKQDSSAVLKPMAEKIINLRIFADEKSKFNLSLLDIKGAALLVPQFTLYADAAKGRRPDFAQALEPEKANQLFEEFVNTFKATGVTSVAQGVFGAYMQVKLENDGPVTLMLEM